MPDVSAAGQPILEVLSPDGSRQIVHITENPFLIGRGGETGNHLQLNDRRISRHSAALVFDGGDYCLEDRGQNRGIFINGEKVAGRSPQSLKDNDVITFGLGDSYELTFHTSSTDSSIDNLLTRMGHITGVDSSPGGLGKLNLLLEATTLLHSQLPLDSVLGSMLDHTVAVTKADRGILLEPDAEGVLRVRLTRNTPGLRMPAESLAPSQTALRLALERQSAVITEDLAVGDIQLQAAESVVAQGLRTVIAIPLYAMHRASTTESAIQFKRGEFLGVVYLDSRKPAAFSKLDRQILDALAVEAASILDNARLVERERQRQRLEQEISIARDIQQALLPHGFRDFPQLAVSGANFPCLTVGGDYFDVFPMGDGRTAFLIADVSGKGLGAALLTTMLQGALSGMTMGNDPARVINHISNFLCEHAEVGRYATMFFGVLDDAGNLEYINAGHPSPLLLRGGEVAEPFTEGSFPVGLIPNASYVALQLRLEPDDTLVLFSDGVTEAMDPQDDLFGVERLRAALEGQQGAPLEQIKKRVLDALDKFTRGASQADDITLLLVRYRGAPRLTQEPAKVPA